MKHSARIYAVVFFILSMTACGKNPQMLPVEKYPDGLHGNWVCGKDSIEKVNSIEGINGNGIWNSFYLINSDNGKVMTVFQNRVTEWNGNVVAIQNNATGSLGVAGAIDDVINLIQGRSRAGISILPGNSNAKLTVIEMSNNALTYKEEVEGRSVVNYCNRITDKEMGDFLVHGNMPAAGNRLRIGG